METMTENSVARGAGPAHEDNIRRKAGELIAALHDLDGSKRGAAFRSASLSRARNHIEMAVAEMERA